MKRIIARRPWPIAVAPAAKNAAVPAAAIGIGRERGAGASAASHGRGYPMAASPTCTKKQDKPPQAPATMRPSARGAVAAVASFSSGRLSSCANARWCAVRE